MNPPLLENGRAESDLGNRAQILLDRLFPQRDIKRVLMVNPPDADSSLFRYETARRKRYTNYPPYGLAVLAQNMRAMDIDPLLLNLNHEVLKACCHSTSKEEFDFDGIWRSKLTEVLLAFKPDLICVTCMFTMTHVSFRTVCRQASIFGIPVAIGGVHVTNDVERILDDIPEAGIAFLSEGEVALKRFIQVVRQERPATDLAQVIFNEKGSRLRFDNEARPTSEEISLVPALDLLQIPEYSSYGTIGAFYCFKPPGTRFATVLSNRGCRAQCTFCSVRNFNGPGVRIRSISSVIDELKWLKYECGVGHFMWLDDDLLRDHRRAISLFDEMVRCDLNMTWDATNGVLAVSCTDEVMAASAASGCIALNIGMESGNAKILREIQKPAKVDSLLRAAEVLQKYEQIHASVFLMVGFPGETLSMIFDTIRVAQQMNLDWYRVNPLQPLPNTPIYDAMVAQGLIQDVGSKEVRFHGGAYGKQAEAEQGHRLASENFKKAFSKIPMDAVPTLEQINDIWFYMNYHLNFQRLFTEDRPTKIRQLFQHLRVLGDVISPENGFALYFLGYLQDKVHGRIEPDIVDRLQKRLSSSAYWRDRLEAFGLSADHLVTKKWPLGKSCSPLP